MRRTDQRLKVILFPDENLPIAEFALKAFFATVTNTTHLE